MIEFLILTIYVLIISLLKFKNNKLQLTLCFLPVFLFLATRVGWTADYYNYEEMFELQHSWSWNDYLVFSSSKFEPGFFYLIKILPSYRFLLFVVSLIYICAIFLFFYFYIPKRYYFLAFILWFYNPTFFESFAAVRSSIVLALFVFAVISKLKGMRLLSLSLIVISGFFHLSGFLLIPFILIPTNFLKKRFTLTSFIVIIALAIIFISPTFFGNLISIFITDSSIDNYSVYMGEGKYGVGFYIFLFFRILFTLYLFSLIKKNLLTGDFLFFALIVIFYYVVASIPNIAIFYRFKTYLYPFIIALQCNVLLKDKSLLSKIYIILTLIYMLFSFYSFFGHPNYLPFFKDYKSSLFM